MALPRHMRFGGTISRTRAKLQRRLLKSSARLLKPGGLLVYSTCTLAPEENEEMAAWLLAEYPDLRSIDFDLPVAGIRHEKGGLTVLPTERLEGFFVAAFRKA